MEHIEPAIMWLAGICVAIGGVWTMIEKVVKPFRDLSKRVAALEEISNGNADKLVADHERLKQQELVNEMLLEGVNNILKHELTGNHTSEMTDCSKRIESFIYKKGGSL